VEDRSCDGDHNPITLAPTDHLDQATSQEHTHHPLNRNPRPFLRSLMPGSLSRTLERPG
jgi:hypothetical protein